MRCRTTAGRVRSSAPLHTDLGVTARDCLDADERWRGERLLHRNPVTPYAGRELTSVVRLTLPRGVQVEGTPRGWLLPGGPPDSASQQGPAASSRVTRAGGPATRGRARAGR